MVTEATFPPYEFREGNAIMGIDPEIMREVARRTGRELVIEDMSFDSVITAVVSGKRTWPPPGITVTPERRGKVDFSIPYVEAAQVIIVPKGSPIRGREDIRGRRIGVQHGATGDIYVTRNIQQPERFPNGALAVAAVAAGKVDAAVIDQDPARMYVAGNDRAGNPAGTPHFRILCHCRPQGKSGTSPGHQQRHCGPESLRQAGGNKDRVRGHAGQVRRGSRKTRRRGELGWKTCGWT